MAKKRHRVGGITSSQAAALDRVRAARARFSATGGKEGCGHGHRLALENLRKRGIVKGGGPWLHEYEIVGEP